jgi:hypothetical protein
MRELSARLDAMETTQRRAPDVGDVSDAERKEIEVEEAAGEDATKEHLLREWLSNWELEKDRHPNV